MDEATQNPDTRDAIIRRLALVAISTAMQAAKNQGWVGLNNPKPGDMVCETTSTNQVFRAGSRENPLDYMGVLIGRETNLVCPEGPMLWVVRKFDGSITRWDNADFIKIPLRRPIVFDDAYRSLPPPTLVVPPPGYRFEVESNHLGRVISLRSDRGGDADERWTRTIPLDSESADAFADAVLDLIDLAREREGMEKIRPSQV